MGSRRAMMLAAFSNSIQRDGFSVLESQRLFFQHSSYSCTSQTQPDNLYGEGSVQLTIDGFLQVFQSRMTESALISDGIGRNYIHPFDSRYSSLRGVNDRCVIRLINDSGATF